MPGCPPPRRSSRRLESDSHASNTSFRLGARLAAPHACGRRPLRRLRRRSEVQPAAGHHPRGDPWGRDAGRFVRDAAGRRRADRDAGRHGRDRRRHVARRRPLVGDRPRRRPRGVDPRGAHERLRRAAGRLARRRSAGERRHRPFRALPRDPGRSGALPQSDRRRIAARIAAGDAERGQSRPDLGDRSVGTDPAPQRGGARRLSRQRGGPPRRAAVAGLRGGDRLLRAARSRSAARHRPAHRHGFPGDVRPVQPAARGGGRLRPRDVERRGVARHDQRQHPGPREPDHRAGEPPRLPPGAPPRTDPPGCRAQRPAAPTRHPVRSSVRPAGAPPRSARSGAASGRRQRRGRRLDRRVLSDAQPDGSGRRRVAPGLRPVRRGADMVGGRRTPEPRVPGAAAQEPAPRRGGPLGGGEG